MFQLILEKQNETENFYYLGSWEKWVTKGYESLWHKASNFLRPKIEVFVDLVFEVTITK